MIKWKGQAFEIANIYEKLLDEMRSVHFINKPLNVR